MIRQALLHLIAFGMLATLSGAAAAGSVAFAQSAGMTFINPEAPNLKSLPDPVSLSEDDLRPFIPALSAVAALGAPVGNLMSGEPGAALDFPEPGELPAGAEAILQEHDLTPEQFTAIGQSVAMAVAALELERNRAEFEQARRQIREMRQQIPPEIYTAVMGQLDGAVTSAARQPRENLALVEDHESDLKQAIMATGEAPDA